MSCYDHDNLFLCFLAQRSAKLELLTPDLPLQHFLCRLGSSLPGNLETGDPFFPWRLGGDWAHSSLCLEVVLIWPLGLLLIRIHGDHDSFKGRQLHLHMHWRGHCSNPVQSRSTQKNVIGWRSINDKIPDVGGAGRCTISEGHPQFYVPPHFHLVMWNRTDIQRNASTGQGTIAACWRSTRTSHRPSVLDRLGRGVPFCLLSLLKSPQGHCRVGLRPTSQSRWRQGMFHLYSSYLICNLQSPKQNNLPNV